MAENITLRGASELNKVLKDLGPKLEKGALTAGLRAAGSVIAKDAKSLAPFDEGVLIKAIGVKSVRGKPNTIRLEVLARKGKREKYNAWYAHFVEFGTDKQPPQPFMRLAFDSNKESAVIAFAQKIKQYLEKRFK